MFKCPNCGCSISVREKTVLQPSKPIRCKKCTQELRPFSVYFYSIFFVGPAAHFLFINYGQLNVLSAAGLAFSISLLLLVCQPMKKVLRK